MNETALKEWSIYNEISVQEYNKLLKLIEAEASQKQLEARIDELERTSRAMLSVNYLVDVAFMVDRIATLKKGLTSNEQHHLTNRE